MSKKVMNKLDVQIELLKELDAVCRENNVKYFLQGETARSAYLNNTFQDEMVNLSVAMTQGDAERIVRILVSKSQSGRYYESLLNNPRYKQPYMVYGNLNTCDFSIVSGNYNKNKGIQIKIYYIENGENRNTKVRKIIKKGWKTVNTKILSNKLWFIKFGLSIWNILFKLIGEERVGRIYYRWLKKKGYIETFNDIKKYEKLRIGGHIYKTKIISDLMNVNVNSTAFPIPKEYDEYFRIVAGKNWKEKPLKQAKKKAGKIINTKIGYKKVINELEKTITEARKNHEKIALANIFSKPYNRQIKRLWKLVLMTRKQVAFQQFFEGKPEAIRDLYNSNDDWETVLNRAKLSVGRYAKHNMTYSINEDIDAKIEQLMLMEGKEKQIIKIRKLRTKKHFL